MKICWHAQSLSRRFLFITECLYEVRVDDEGAVAIKDSVVREVQLRLNIQLNMKHRASRTTDCNGRVATFNHLKTQLRLLYLKTQSVPHCKQFSSRL